MRAQVQTALEKLTHYVEKEEWKGYDPYDALNSPLLRLFSGGTKAGRIVVTQCLKRFPWNVRPFLGIDKEWNAKGLGLFMRGYTKLSRGDPFGSANENIARLGAILGKMVSPQASGTAWGYPFDWQSRAFYAPRGTPTIVNTSFIGHALLDGFERTRQESLLDLAMGIPDFFLKDLNRTRDASGFCFSYTPLDRSCVHNANLLGASLLIRLNQYAPHQEWAQAAREALHYSLSRQQEDGSWFYGEYPYQRWIDSFHTGFNLEALAHFIRAGFSADCQKAFDRGKLFYREHFFLEDATPRYYHNSTYPLDIHAPAEAVIFFSGQGPECLAFSESILSWMLRHLQSPKGFFYFQVWPYYQVKIPYMRWAQAWAFLALASYLSAEAQTANLAGQQ